MRALMMLILGILCMCAHDAGADEPFGASVYPGAKWLTKLRAQYREVATIRRIADEVMFKHGLARLGWLNQKVNLSVPGNCAAKAVAKCEVARLLVLPCEIVVGQSWARDPAGHVMAAILQDGKWRILDNGHVVAHHFTPTDADVRKFNPGSFRAQYVLKVY